MVPTCATQEESLSVERYDFAFCSQTLLYFDARVESWVLHSKIICRLFEDECDFSLVSTSSAQLNTIFRTFSMHLHHIFSSSSNCCCVSKYGLRMFWECFEDIWNPVHSQPIFNDVQNILKIYLVFDWKYGIHTSRRSFEDVFPWWKTLNNKFLKMLCTSFEHTFHSSVTQHSWSTRKDVQTIFKTSLWKNQKRENNLQLCQNVKRNYSRKRPGKSAKSGGVLPNQISVAPVSTTLAPQAISAPSHAENFFVHRTCTNTGVVQSR